MNPALPASLKDRVLGAANHQPSLTRAQLQRRALAGYGAAAAAMLACFELAGGVAHSSGRPIELTLRIAAGAAVLALAATAVVFARGRSMVGRPIVALIAVALLVPVATFAWLTPWSTHYVEPFARVGYRCFGLTMLLAAMPLAIALAVRRRTVATAPGWTGAAIGAALGAWGALAVDLWCPLTNVAHVAVGHVAPLFVLAAVGAGLGGALLGVQRGPST